MSPEESQLLKALFDRVRQASTTTRDRDAEALINDELRAQPYAAYYLAQAVIMQEKGLEAAAARIQALEGRIKDLEDRAQPQPQSQQQGGFLNSLGSIFGGNGANSVPQTGQSYLGAGRSEPPPLSGPWGQQAYTTQQPSRGGGFLAGAMTTAAGVAGGMLMADAVRSLFAPHFGVGGLFGGGGLTGAPVVDETVVNNYFLDGNNGANSNASDGSVTQDDTLQQAALSDLSDATQNAGDVDNASYDDSSFDDGGYDDSNYA